MKKYVQTILSSLILIFFLLVAGGSTEDLGRGDFLSLLMILLVIIIILIINAFITSDDKSQLEEESRRKKEEEEKREIEEKFIALKDVFNAPITNVINYSNGKYILVSEEKSLIMINENIYHFKDILDYTLSDNSVSVLSTTDYKTTTDTGSMIGRAVVGGILTGGTGAIIGGTTASKRTTASGGITRQKHSYTLFITVDSLSHPTERIFLREKEYYANQICSILSIIINRNKNQ